MRALDVLPLPVTDLYMPIQISRKTGRTQLSGTLAFFRSHSLSRHLEHRKLKMKSRCNLDCDFTLASASRESPRFNPLFILDLYIHL